MAHPEGLTLSEILFAEKKIFALHGISQAKSPQNNHGQDVNIALCLYRKRFIHCLFYRGGANFCILYFKNCLDLYRHVHRQLIGPHSSTCMPTDLAKNIK